MAGETAGPKAAFYRFLNAGTTSSSNVAHIIHIWRIYCTNFG